MDKIQHAAAPVLTTYWQSLRSSKLWRHATRNLLSYSVLSLGAAFMLFPMLWMLSASLKPAWQIFTDPPIWIPHHWETIRVGNTNRELNLWQVEVDGQNEKVIQIGLRRYTTVVDAALLETLETAPTSELSDAAATTIGDLTLNIRQWTTEEGVRDVVALARGDGDTLVVASLDALLPAVLRMPLDEVNSGGRTTFTIDGIEFRGRAVEIDGTAREVFAIGPESQFTVVGDPSMAAAALLVTTAGISSAGFAAVGETELPRITVEGLDGEYLELVRESWQPVIDEAEFDAEVFIAPRTQLTDMQLVVVNNVTMSGATYTPEDGEPFQVAILISGNQASAVIPTDRSETLHLAPLGSLSSARGDQLNRIPYRVQDGYTEDGEVSSVVLVGEQREMALVVPVAVVDEAFDVSSSALQRSMYPQLRFDGYIQALQTKVGETYFLTFFRNSFVLVALNIIGHVMSCVVVAYAFARLRAPGKNILFIILLGTLMLPYPVTLVPVYEIFRDLGMVNSLWPLFLRSFFGNAFLIFMLRQFFTSIPRELEDAARIDGAGTVGIIRHVIVPLSRPAIATVVIFTFWWTWNNFLEPFIFLSSPELFPVAVGLNFFKDQYLTIYYDRLIGASVMSMIPMILLFFFAQRYFIEGIQLTGLKG